MRATAPRSIDALAVIEEEALAVARCFGVPVDAEMAAALVERLALRLGGHEVYIAASKTKRATRDAGIRKRFAGGASYAQLSSEEGLSERQVRNIVHGLRRRN